MNVIDRDVPLNVCTVAPGRPFLGAVIHHTATTGLPFPVRGGSWHYCIDRDGTIYRDVDEVHAAHHTGATDRFRPSWVVPSRVGVSDINYCSIGLEVVYAPQEPHNQTPTGLQYAAVRELFQDVYRRRGQLWTVGHGQVDLSKWPTEPHAFDWARAGFGLFAPNWGRHFIGAVAPIPPEVPDVSILNDDQARAAAEKLWAVRGVPYVPDFAIPAAWLAEWRAGRYRGLPAAGEQPVEDGQVHVQPFDQGAATWKNGEEVSWDC